MRVTLCLTCGHYAVYCIDTDHQFLPRGSAKQNTYSVLIAPCNLLLLLRCSSAPPAAARAATLLSPLQIIGIFISTEMPDLSFCVNPLRS